MPKLLNKISLQGKTFVIDYWEGYHRLIPDDQLFTNSPENRSFFGEGVKIVVEVVLDPPRQINHYDDLGDDLRAAAEPCEKVACCCCPVRWGGQVFASSKPPLTYATFMRAAKVRNGPIMPL